MATAASAASETYFDAESESSSPPRRGFDALGSDLPTPPTKNYGSPNTVAFSLPGNAVGVFEAQASLPPKQVVDAKEALASSSPGKALDAPDIEASAPPRTSSDSMHRETFSSPRKARALRRLSTHFPEDEPSNDLGPWRTTLVEGHHLGVQRTPSDSWLLVGRRHSVDERRDGMQQAKAKFLRVLAERADGVWRSRTAARAAELHTLEEKVNAQLTRQAQLLQASLNFWQNRHAADQAYLARLELCVSGGKEPLPGTQACHEAQWRSCIQQAEGSSAMWAADMPLRIEDHRQIEVEVRRAIARAIGDAEAAGRLVLAARGAVWPVTSPAWRSKALPPGSHSVDVGPEGMCLWQAVRNYLAACDSLQEAQHSALARVYREQRRIVALGEWVDEVLNRGSESSRIPASSMSASRGHHAGAGDGEQTDRLRAGSDSDSSDDDALLDMSMDISALVVHAQDVDVRYSMDQGCAWAPSRLLVSVDLWLHVWGPAASPQEGTPSHSIPLARACLRPVAERHGDEAGVLRLRFRPAEPAGILTRLSRFVWDSERGVPPTTMFIRCAHDEAAADLLGALELVEKLYPILS